MPFIDDITCTIYDMSSTVYITFTLCVISHNACISDITHSLFMTYPLYLASYTVLWQHSNCVTSQPLCLTSHPLCLCHHTEWINFIIPSVGVTSEPLCVWHHMYYMWHHIHNLGHHTMPVSLTSHTLCLWCIHFIWHHTQCYDNTNIRKLHSHYTWHHTTCICVITHSGSILSNAVHVWHPSHYVYDIICTICDITSTI